MYTGINDDDHHIGQIRGAVKIKKSRIRDFVSIGGGRQPTPMPLLTNLGVFRAKN